MLSVEERFWSKVNKDAPNGCWEWQASKRGKYGHFWLNNTFVFAHRYAYEISNGAIEHEKVIMHKCDNPSCVNPEHLIQGTHKENTADMLAKGRDKFPTLPLLSGTKHPSSKLTDDKVREMRSLEGSYTQRELAKKYGVTQGVVWQILKRKNWKHVA